MQRSVFVRLASNPDRLMRVVRKTAQNSASVARKRFKTFGSRRKLDPNRETDMDLRIETLVALMRDDPTQRLSLSKMAKQVNLSRARLCYLFKSESGMSASRYLKSLRMKEAAVLLSTTFLSVKEII